MTKTAGIARVEYEGGIVRQLLFKLGIDEATSGYFRSPIGPNTCEAQHILSPDLRVIDKGPMLTTSVANLTSLTLRCISDRRKVNFRRQ
jgi:hypothetical protein